MLHFIAVGTILGLSAGFSPGPLLALVITESLRHGVHAGVKIAIAPLITDIPIILLCFLLSRHITGFSSVLAGISFCGAAFVAWMGVANMKTKRIRSESIEDESFTLGKGILTNLLSPHPYLFWLSVGVPIMSKALRHDGLHVAAFLLCFYFFLVGAKIFLAAVVGKSQSFLTGKPYVLVMRILGVVLCLLAAILVIDGIKLLHNGLG